VKAGVKLVVGIAIAGAAVAWADVALLRLFLDEKADARERVALERRVIEGAARSAIVDALRAALARAELEAGAVFDDPLRDDLGLVEIYDGKQIIPRVAPGHPEHESGDRSLYEVLKNGGPIRVDSSPSARRSTPCAPSSRRRRARSSRRRCARSSRSARTAASS
jgi:hypothetical protein